MDVAAGGASLATGVVVPRAGSAASAAWRGLALGATGSAFFASGFGSGLGSGLGSGVGAVFC